MLKINAWNQFKLVRPYSHVEDAMRDHEQIIKYWKYNNLLAYIF